MPKTPSYRSRKGYPQALVTLTDSVTKKRRDYWLGEHGSTESRELYHRVVAEWEANGRRWPNVPPAEMSPSTPGLMQLVELLNRFRKWAEQFHDEGEQRSYDVLIRLIRQFYGHTPAADFGPRKLRFLREQMICGDDKITPPRKAWSRNYINSQVQRIRRMFKWAASQELVPVAVYQSLCTIEPLRRGRSQARENAKVGPVPQHMLDATLPHLCRPVRALVDLQLLTGARPNELLALRACDLEMDNEADIWLYRPGKHKNAFREKERLIYFGPKAQAVIRPFLTGRATNAFLFSPADAETGRRMTLHAARTTPLSCGNRPGSNRQLEPRRRPGDQYTPMSYCRAIQYACQKAFPLPTALAPQQTETLKEWHSRIRSKWDDVKAWRRAHRWFPYQLRHNAATLLRREFGLEAAQLTLGHASAQITDAVYAERDRAKVVEIMKKIG